MICSRRIYRSRDADARRLPTGPAVVMRCGRPSRSFSMRNWRDSSGPSGRVHTSAATSASTSGNGHYPRRIVTTAGEVDVRVGRSRDGGAANAPLGRYARRRPEIDAAITQAYVHGVSTRDMAGVTTVLGKRVGHSTVSRVTQRLEAEVETLRTAHYQAPHARRRRLPDRASALRLITAVALQVTSIWSEPRLPRYVPARPQLRRRGLTFTDEDPRCSPSGNHTKGTCPPRSPG